MNEPFWGKQSTAVQGNFQIEIKANIETVNIETFNTESNTCSTKSKR